MSVSARVVNALEHRVHFATRDPQILSLQAVDPDDHPELFLTGTQMWIGQTYLRLRDSDRFAVSLSAELDATTVNVIYSAERFHFAPRRGLFLVVARGDYPRAAWADFHIVQNQTQCSESAEWLPHWPQPGLIPRNPSRSVVQTVAYAGHPYNLGTDPDLWEDALRSLGLEMKVFDEGEWNDLEDVDILVATRSFDGRTFDSKPPHKLINAWLAGIPLVAGPESAFSQIGTPGLEYVVVKTFDEALRGIERLKSDPEFYSSIVARGKAKASAFSPPAVAQRWEQLFQERIFSLFEAQKAQRGGVQLLRTGQRKLGFRVQQLQNQVYQFVPARIRRRVNPNFP